MKKIELIKLGSFGVNSYTVYDDELKEAVIIDPGADAQKVIDFLSENNLTPKSIMITHAHFDHIGAAEELRNKYEIPVLIVKDDEELLLDGKKNLSSRFGGLAIEFSADQYLEEGQEYKPFSDDTTFLIIQTPGHSIGSASFYVKELATVFSGDTLFKNSIGRTDCFSSDFVSIIRSIKEKLMKLPTETVVMPGHGGFTTIGDEFEKNPFINNENIN